MIVESARRLQPHLVMLRREFHRCPEISGHEAGTADKIRKELEAIGGYELRTGIGGCGIVASLRGAKPGKTVALRADMDALQVTEETGLSFGSKVPGVMHACGHDNHITMLLGAARLLAERREELAGSVRLIFQPSEEMSPHGGSRDMIAGGAMEGVDAVFGMHVWPELPLGCIGVKAGPLMAASDHFTVKIKGCLSHAARPNEGVDALVAGSQFVTAVQTIVSRNADPMKSMVITIGKFEAGTRYNIVAGECVLEGTCRTFAADMRDLAEKRLNEILQGVCLLSGCTGTLDYERGYMAVINDPSMAKYMKKTASELFGPGKAVSVEPAMTAEDFSFYLAEKPGAFAWIGTTAAGETAWSLHSSRYNPNEEVLWRGAAMLTGLVMNFDSDQEK